MLNILHLYHQLMFFSISATLPPVLGSQLHVSKIKICECIENEPAVLGRLSDQLHRERLITPAVQKAVKFVDGKSPYDKADSMISPAIERVRSDPEKNGPALVRALTNVGLGSVVMEFFQTPYGKLQQ